MLLRIPEFYPYTPPRSGTLNLVIARLDKLSRNEDVQQKLQAPDCRWDLVVCDEAHKMSATVFGGETKYTKRYRLGQLLSTLTRHFLLMSATPHNGKEADFQLFMALLDGDRFEGRYRDGVHSADVSDLMRRMVKENLLKFDGTPLFPERIAHTVPYRLSDAETHLYKTVTDYVREEFNRAEALENDKRAGTVGFALTILQGCPCGLFTVRSPRGNPGYESVQRVTLGIGVQPPPHCSTSAVSTHSYSLSSSGVARAASRNDR